jgi:hypothetical protein
LYQALPQMLNKTVIEYPAPLHSRISRSIEIANTTNKTVIYRCELPQQNQFYFAAEGGNSDNKTQVCLPPKAVTQIAVDFLARFSKPFSTSLTLKSGQMTVNNASLLVFQLQSVAEIKPITNIARAETQMYQSSPPSSVQLTIENPFDTRGEFNVYLREERPRSANALNKARSRQNVMGSTLHLSKTNLAGPIKSIKQSEVEVILICKKNR